MTVSSISGYFDLLPPEMKCEVYSHLGVRALMKVKRLNSQFKSFVEDEFPKLRPELDAAHRIELAFMKFNDRPILQKVGLVSLCVIFSPVILAYYSPTIYKRFKKPLTALAHRVADQVVRVGRTVLVTFPQKITETLLVPLGQKVHEKVLLPLAKTIREIAKKSFEVSLWTYKNLLTPLGHGILHVHRLAIVPLGRAIHAVARAALTQAYRHILRPLGQTLRTIARISRDYLLIPAHRAAYTVIRGIYQSLLTPLGHGLLRAGKVSFQHALIPAAKVIRALANGIIVTVPVKIYVHLLKPASQILSSLVLRPMGNIISAFSRAAYRHILVPAAHLIHLGSRICYSQVLQPAISLIQSIANTVFIDLPSLCKKAMIDPAVYHVVSTIDWVSMNGAMLLNALLPK